MYRKNGMIYSIINRFKTWKNGYVWRSEDWWEIRETFRTWIQSQTKTELCDNIGRELLQKNVIEKINRRQEPSTLHNNPDHVLQKLKTHSIITRLYKWGSAKVGLWVYFSNFKTLKLIYRPWYRIIYVRNCTVRCGHSVPSSCWNLEGK